MNSVLETRRKLHSALFSWIILLLLLLASTWSSNAQRVRLEDVSTITLRAGKMTNARQVAAIPQLTCIGGSAGCHVSQPTLVHCANMGSDGHDVEWECSSDMDPAYRFGHIEVSCEGYDYPDDPYIVRGSCGLAYELDVAEEGYYEARPHLHHHGSKFFILYLIEDIIGSMVLILFCCMLCCCGLCVCCCARAAGGSERSEKVIIHHSSSSRSTTSRPRSTSGSGGTTRR